MSESVAVNAEESSYNENGAIENQIQTTSLNRKRFSIPGQIDIEEESLEVMDKSAIPQTKENIKSQEKPMEFQESVLVDGRYQNPWSTWKPPTYLNVLKFFMSKNYSKIPSKKELDKKLPIVKPEFDLVPTTGISVTWIGHATTLVQFDGATILTDPIFSSRCSPSQFVGVKRYRNPPCTIKELPEVDAVVISHNHYDHLDTGSVMELNERFGEKLRWFVPMRLASWMHSMGCKNVVELDWWESGTISEEKNIVVAFTPAQHWSKRSLIDDYKTLWGSWSIIGPKHRFFFAGDTGYCEAFKQIGRKYGPFDLAAIPIGAYEPRWIMQYQHVNPEDAIQVHEDVGSKCSLGIHWGTFVLTNEFYLEPRDRLKEILEARNIPSSQFFTLNHGETRIIDIESQV